MHGRDTDSIKPHFCYTTTRLTGESEKDCHGSLVRACDRITDVCIRVAHSANGQPRLLINTQLAHGYRWQPLQKSPFRISTQPETTNKLRTLHLRATGSPATKKAPEQKALGHLRDQSSSSSSSRPESALTTKQASGCSLRMLCQSASCNKWGAYLEST
jgi:hypothetical protein